MIKSRNRNKSDVERFVNLIELSNNGCWNWIGSIDAGRCIFSVKNKNVKAQEFILGQRAPHGLSVLFSCSNKQCVNPAHLSFGPKDKTPVLRGDPLELFMTHVDKQPNECWYWTAAKSHGGYGVVRRNGRNYPAHRWIYEYINGELPDKTECDHLCRNRSCVNPDHIEPVTKLENVRRGESGKWQRDKTHCPHGHEYTEENTMWTIHKHKNGTHYNTRVCRKCQEIKRSKPEAREKHKEYAKQWHKLHRQKTL